MTDAPFMTSLAELHPLRRALARVTIGQILIWVALGGGAWIAVFPYIWMVSSSLKPTNEVYDADFTIWPKSFAVFENYHGVLFEQPYPLFLMNSTIVCLGILLVQLVTAIPAGYAVAKLRFRAARSCWVRSSPV